MINLYEPSSEQTLHNKIMAVIKAVCPVAGSSLFKSAPPANADHTLEKYIRCDQRWRVVQIKMFFLLAGLLF